MSASSQPSVSSSGGGGDGSGGSGMVVGVTRKALQEQNFLREMDLTPVTMVNCLRSTHSDVMHLATTVLAFQQTAPPRGFGAKLNTGTMAQVLNPKSKKQRVKPIATRKKHMALLREHADFMARLNAERTERLEIESWAASQLQVAVRRFLRRTDRRFGGAGGATASAFDPAHDRFLQSLATPEQDLREEIRVLVQRSNHIVDEEDDDLYNMPPWRREEEAKARAAERAARIRRKRVHVVTRLQAMARGFVARKAVRYALALEQEERQVQAATFIQARARVFTAKTAEFKMQQRRVAKSVVIQALFRGFVDRAVVGVIHARLHEYSKRVDSAVRIQAQARRMLARNRIAAVHQEKAAVRIQANVRAANARRDIERDRQVGAATTIQAKVRAKQAEREAQARREDQAACRMQASGRGMLARKEVQARREAAAATKIQAARRGKAVRDAEARRVQEEAAVQIQAARRGKAARDLAKAQEASAVAVQKVVRGAAGRRQAAAQADAATKIQAVQRGRAERAAAERRKKDAAAATVTATEATETAESAAAGDDNAKHDAEVPTVTEAGEEDAEAAAAAKLQALARGRAARAEREAQERAAVEVQKVVRGRQDRGAVERLREERKATLEAEAAAQDGESRRVKRRDIP